MAMTAPPVRKILHVDMDAFYASVEQRDDPSLRGRPVVVAWRGGRSVVCAASYEARVFGVRSAMPAIRAERLCPQAVFVPPDFVRYKAVSRQVREIFSRHTDLVEPLSLDEAYLDVTALASGLPSATATAEAIRAAIFEETALTASAGVAPNKFIAKIASDWNKPDGICVVRPRQVDAFLLPLPVGRLPGVGKVMQGKLADLGVATVGQRFQRRRSLRRGQAAGEDAEVAGLELEHHRAGKPAMVLYAFALVAGPGLFGQTADLRFQFVEPQVVLEGVLRGNLHGRAFRPYRVVVDTQRQLMQAPAPATEAQLQLGRR